METNLIHTPWICNKVKSTEIYAQNLYAALCNNQFVQKDGDEPWSCSWRYAGGLIAMMRGEGDYLDWYMSGGMLEYTRAGFVNESKITDEIRNDLLKLGWKILPRQSSIA